MMVIEIDRRSLWQWKYEPQLRGRPRDLYFSSVDPSAYCFIRESIFKIVCYVRWPRIWRFVNLSERSYLIKSFSTSRAFASGVIQSKFAQFRVTQSLFAHSAWSSRDWRYREMSAFLYKLLWWWCQVGNFKARALSKFHAALLRSYHSKKSFHLFDW